VESVYERAILKAKSPSVIPVLMYHRIVADAPAQSQHGVWVTAEKFESQLASLQKRGFSAITFRQYHNFRNGRTSLPPKPIILTFDDGYEDNYAIALPLLRKYRSTAVIYMVADNKRRTNYWDADEPQVPLMAVEQMREMAQAGIEFGSHTITHARLTKISLAAARKEIKESKLRLERMLGQEVVSFAYPYGALNESCKKLVEEAGYRYAAAADSGPMNLAADFYEIRRIQVFPWTTLFGFWKKTQSWYGAYKERKAMPAESGADEPSVDLPGKFRS
jgi:peptidoglycan/xylan/chitin deacetylase (PgdA/CDA1 family)